MIDHVFLTYFHPITVTCLIVAIFISARNFVTVARTVGRYVNSKSICVLLILSYNSVCYTSIQLFRPLAVNMYMYRSYNDMNIHVQTEWHSYLSPNELYFHNRHMIYCIITILCEVVIGFGPPLFYYSNHTLPATSILTLSIKPVIDQLKGCYKEEYRWFAAYYLICRQLIYGGDVFTDFYPLIKFPVMLSVCVLIMMIYVWLQPHKERKLNALDSSILMILLLVFIGEHISYASTLTLWILPLVLFINCVTFSNRLKHLLIPVSSLGIFFLSFFIYQYVWAVFSPDEYLDQDYDLDEDTSFYAINMTIQVISSLVFIGYLIYILR